MEMPAIHVGHPRGFPVHPHPAMEQFNSVFSFLLPFIQQLGANPEGAFGIVLFTPEGTVPNEQPLILTVEQTKAIIRVESEANLNL